VLYPIELLKKYGSPMETFLLSAFNARFSEERTKYDEDIRIFNI
jgi:hypothetical protein